MVKTGSSRAKFHRFFFYLAKHANNLDAFFCNLGYLVLLHLKQEFKIVTCQN